MCRAGNLEIKPSLLPVVSPSVARQSAKKLEAISLQYISVPFIITAEY
jgi:hypothetical protein